MALGSKVLLVLAISVRVKRVEVGVLVAMGVIVKVCILVVVIIVVSVAVLVAVAVLVSVGVLVLIVVLAAVDTLETKDYGVQSRVKVSREPGCRFSQMRSYGWRSWSSRGYSYW